MSSKTHALLLNLLLLPPPLNPSVVLPLDCRPTTHPLDLKEAEAAQGERLPPRGRIHRESVELAQEEEQKVGLVGALAQENLDLLVDQLSVNVHGVETVPFLILGARLWPFPVNRGSPVLRPPVENTGVE